MRCGNCGRRRIYGDGGHHAGSGNRSDDGHLHAGASGDAEVAAGGQAGGAVADRGQDPLLQLGRIHAGERRRLFALLVGGVQEFPRPHAGVRRPGSSAGRQCAAGRAASRIAGAGGHAQRAVRLRKFLPHPGRAARGLGAADDRRRRSTGRAAGGGDELSRLEGEVRLRSFGGRREVTRSTGIRLPSSASRRRDSMARSSPAGACRTSGCRSRRSSFWMERRRG